VKAETGEKNFVYFAFLSVAGVKERL